jgi:DNA-binding NtrC family response regulator
MEPRKILIVEDSQPTREYLSELVQILGFQTHTVMQKADFLPDFNRNNPDVLLLGSCYSPGQVKAFAKVVELQQKCLPIIYIKNNSDQGEPDTIPLGDNISCLPKSFNPDDLKLAIHRTIKKSQDGEYAILNETIVGGSNAMMEIKKNILRLSKSDATVLITGESGTGKELVARAIHDLSLRAKKPFVKVNSAALPDNLIESELFGYSRRHPSFGRDRRHLAPPAAQAASGLGGQRDTSPWQHHQCKNRCSRLGLYQFGFETGG